MFENVKDVPLVEDGWDWKAAFEMVRDAAEAKVASVYVSVPMLAGLCKHTEELEKKTVRRVKGAGNATG